MKTYSKGDVVWFASCKTERVDVECDVCFGKKQVTLVLGNGEQFLIPCSYCGTGFDAPRGVVSEYRWVAEPKQIMISSVKTEDTDKGIKVEYGFDDNYIAYVTEVFDTKEDAIARCIEHTKEYEKDQNERKMHIIKDRKRSIAWSVGYHRREIKQLRGQLEYHEKQVLQYKQKEERKESK